MLTNMIVGTAMRARWAKNFLGASDYNADFT
jgi:hypothetical protein